MFNIYQGPSESLREYLACFNESMIKFQNILKTEHFNEPLTQKSELTLAEVVVREKCYIKDDERNVEKMARDTKEVHLAHERKISVQKGWGKQQRFSCI